MNVICNLYPFRLEAARRTYPSLTRDSKTQRETQRERAQKTKSIVTEVGIINGGVKGEPVEAFHRTVQVQSFYSH